MTNTDININVLPDDLAPRNRHNTYMQILQPVIDAATTSQQLYTDAINAYEQAVLPLWSYGHITMKYYNRSLAVYRLYAMQAANQLMPEQSIH